MASQTARPASQPQVPHARAVLRTVPPAPLGPPSAAAKAFLPEDADPYAAWRLPHSDLPAYVQPSDALAKSAALTHERASVSAIKADRTLRGAAEAAEIMLERLAAELLRLADCAASHTQLAHDDPDTYVEAVRGHFQQLLPDVADIRRVLIEGAQS